MKASMFILEFIVTEPTNDHEKIGDIYYYKEDIKFEPGYYLGKRGNSISKSLFYLINRPHNYTIIKIKQNTDIIKFNY